MVDSQVAERNTITHGTKAYRSRARITTTTPVARPHTEWSIQKSLRWRLQKR
jgi:hypothetical protein